MTQAPAEAAFAQIDADEEAVVELARALISRQALGEDEVQALVAEQLAASGGAVETLTYRPRDVPVIDEFAATEAAVDGERRSVIGTFAAASAGGRSLILFAHPDAEPTHGAETWSRAPFAGELDNGRLYGWGIADDLAGIVIALSAMDSIRKAGIRLAGDVIVASTPSKRHTRGIAALLHEGRRADAALYLHPAESGAGLHEIKALASGQLEFEITVSGQRPATTEPGHTAFSHLAESPLDKALLLIEAIRQFADELAERSRHPLLEAAVSRSSNIMISALQFGGDGPISQLPETLTFGGAISFPPEVPMTELQAEFETVVRNAAAGDSWLAAHPPALKWISGVSGSEVKSDHPFYRTVAGAVERVCGYAPQVNPMHTSSDIRNPMVQKGIPTLGIGPLCGDLTHSGGTDEWVDRDDLLRAVKVTAATIIEWCGVAG